MFFTCAALDLADESSSRLTLESLWPPLFSVGRYLGTELPAAGERDWKSHVFLGPREQDIGVESAAVRKSN